METLIAQLQNKAQIKAVKTILDAFGASYKIKPDIADDETAYLMANPTNASRLLSAIDNVNNENTISIKREDLWK